MKFWNIRPLYAQIHYYAKKKLLQVETLIYVTVMGARQLVPCHIRQLVPSSFARLDNWSHPVLPDWTIGPIPFLTGWTIGPPLSKMAWDQ